MWGESNYALVDIHHSLRVVVVGHGNILHIWRISAHSFDLGDSGCIGQADSGPAALLTAGISMR